MCLSPTTANDQARLTYLNTSALHVPDELHVHNIPPRLGLRYQRPCLQYTDGVHGELRELMHGLRSLFEGAAVVVEMTAVRHHQQKYLPVDVRTSLSQPMSGSKAEAESKTAPSRRHKGQQQHM